MVSVIIPTYNRADFLREALTSVLAQTWFRDKGPERFEVVVVDDGSTDATSDVVHPFREEIRFFRQEQNRGVSTARNLGLAVAKGEFVAFLDSDDLWKPEKIEVQMDFLETHPDAQVCQTEEIWIRKGVRVNPRKKHQNFSGWVFEKYLPLCLLSLSAALFRRDVFETIGVFDETLPVCEDYDLGLRLSHRYPVYLINEKLTVKRGGHQDQLSRAVWGMDRYRIQALKKALALPLSEKQRDLVRQEIVCKCRILIKGFVKRGKTEEAAEYKKLVLEIGKNSL